MKKLIVIFMICVLCICIAIPAVATEETETESGSLTVVGTCFDDTDYGVSPMAYYDWENFSFSGRHIGASRWYDGGHMALEISGRSNVQGLTIQVTVHIVGDRTITHNVPIDGYVYKWDWISLATTSGRTVYVEYSCNQNPNATIQIQAKSYSW